VRIAKGLTTEATSLGVAVSKNNVTITSQKKDEPLSKAKWMVLNAGGFTTEEAAQHFGIGLCRTLQLASLSSRLGVDIGENKPTDWVNEEFARSTGLLKEHERLEPNVHGLAILPNDDNTRFPIFNAEGIVTTDPEQFASALREAGENGDTGFGMATDGVRLLNLALERFPVRLNRKDSQSVKDGRICRY
jgi:hypothetical protein